MNIGVDSNVFVAQPQLIRVLRVECVCCTMYFIYVCKAPTRARFSSPSARVRLETQVSLSRVELTRAYIVLSRVEHWLQPDSTWLEHVSTRVWGRALLCTGQMQTMLTRKNKCNFWQKQENHRHEINDSLLKKGSTNISENLDQQLLNSLY